MLTYTSPVAAPPRAVNGGLYTGEPFAPGAPWANVPIVPDAHIMVQNLQSANPPPGALALIPGSDRPGNNKTEFPAHDVFRPDKYKIRCIR